MNNQKLFIRGSISIIIGIIVVVVVVAGIVLWQAGLLEKKITPAPTSTPTPTVSPAPSPTSTPAQTAGWKTYRSETYGFELKYPPKWILGSPYKNAYNDLVIDVPSISSPPRYGEYLEKFPHVGITSSIQSFSKSSLEEWDKMIKEQLAKGEDIGESGVENWIDPVILNEKEGTLCDLKRPFILGSECKIIKIGDKKFLQFLGETYGFYGVLLSYRTAKSGNQRWIEINVNFSVITGYDSSKFEYKFLSSKDILELLTKILKNENYQKDQQKEWEIIIRQQIQEINQVLSTFRFIK